MTVIYSHARLEDPKTVGVSGETLTAPRIFLSNVGARPVIPDLPGLADIDYLTSTSIIHLDNAADSIWPLSAAAISAWSSRRCTAASVAAVTVIEHGPKLASREDEDISDAIADILRSEGIDVHADVKDLPSPERRRACDRRPPTPTTIEASHVLIAIGRTAEHRRPRPRSPPAWHTDKRGYITVDDRLATNVEGIWALG